MSTTLTPDAAAGGTSSTDTEPTLAEAFGEFSQALVESEDASAGTAETQHASGDTAAPSADTRGTSDAPGTQAAPPADAGTKTPSAQTTQNAPTTAAPDSEADPLAGAIPLTYTVDRETRTFAGVHEVPGMGAVVERDALPRLKDRLQQADRLVEQNRALYAESQEFQRLGGRAKVEELTANAAMLDKAASLLIGALTNEETLLTLATDPVARQHLIRELELSGREAQNAARSTFRNNHTQATQQAHQASQTAAQSQTAIGNAVVEIAKQFPSLTAEDVSAVRAHASRVSSAIVRPANAEEARTAGVRPGELIIDLATLHTFLSDRHSLRQQYAAAATTAANTARDNAARLAAAAPTAGKSTPTATPRPGAGKKVVPVSDRPIDTMTSAEITRAMKTGRIFSMMGDET